MHVMSPPSQRASTEPYAIVPSHRLKSSDWSSPEGMRNLKACASIELRPTARLRHNSVVSRLSRYNSGATLPGKKGTKVCLNIFSDFAYIHTEWKDQKGLGWSPGYTVQTILMNVVAFLAETQSGDSSWMKVMQT